MSAVTLRIQGESDARPNERPRLAVCRDMVQRENNQATRDKTAAGIPDAMFMTHYQCPLAYSDRAVSRLPRMVANRTHAQHCIHVSLARTERSRKSHVRKAIVGKCFNHGSKDRLRAAHVFPSWLRSLLWHLPLRNHLLKDCALKQHIGARTWETAVVLAPWMGTDLTLLHNHVIRTTSCSHPRYIHLPCHDMQVIVNNEYVHHLRPAQ